VGRPRLGLQASPGLLLARQWAAPSSWDGPGAAIIF
jgi:hypothetical protein